MRDIVAVGDCGVDIYAEVPRLPGYDEKVPGNFIGIFGGGVAANFACAASRLGMKAGLVSTVGDDDFGRRAVESVREFGVDTGGIRVKAGVPSHFCFVNVDARGEKSLTIVRTPAFAPTWEDVPIEYLVGTRLVHIAPFDLDMATRVAAHAASSGIAVSIDLEPGSALAGLDALMPLIGSTNVLLTNQQCLETLFGHVPVEEAARGLLDLGPIVIVITRGELGSFVLTLDRAATVSAFRVIVRDTTGAGDCFNAAFISCWLRGRSPLDCATYASAAAALSIQTFGARGGLPTEREVERFLRLSTTEASS